MDKVQLEVFEGPLDLLLHLIKKEDLDIYDIPVTKLLEQYLNYLTQARELNIDLAGEFLETAAELAYIKSRMLLPEVEEEEDQGPDPRADLLARLLEYQRFKMAAGSLLQRPLLDRDIFRRPPEEDPQEEPDILMEADMPSLLSAFQEVLKRLPKDQYHEISHKGVGTAERVIQLTEFLRGKKQSSFEDLFEGDVTRGDVVVTFLAILEMSKQSLLRILQDKVFSRIMVLPLFSEENIQEISSIVSEY